MTDTATLTEIGEMNQVDWDAYEQASGSKTLPPDGEYYLRMPDTFEDAAFELKQNERDGAFLSINIDPATIAGGNYDGTQVRFLRIDTRRIPEFKKENGGWVRTGKLLNASDAGDLLNNFQTGDRPNSVEEWKGAVKRLAGQTTPTPVRLVWSGYDKKAIGKAKYLKSKEYTKLADGSRPAYVVRVDPSTGEEYKVYANLALGVRGFSGRG